MSTGARTDAIDSWESLIASRMRPCATMPKEEDTSKRAKKIVSERYEKKRKAQGIAQEMAAERGRQEVKARPRRTLQAHREGRKELAQEGDDLLLRAQGRPGFQGEEGRKATQVQGRGQGQKELDHVGRKSSRMI